MKSLKQVVVLGVIATSLSFLNSGCGGPDNEKTMLTNPDGTTEAAGTAPASNITSADAYNSSAKTKAAETINAPKAIKKK